MELEYFLSGGLLSDLTVLVGEQRETFRLHKLQLCQHSGYFLQIARHAHVAESLQNGPEGVHSNHGSGRCTTSEGPTAEHYAEANYVVCSQSNAFAKGTIALINLPGGSEAFHVIVEHCYGADVSTMLTKCNVVAVHCAAVFLKLKSGADGILSKTARFMEEHMLNSAGGALDVLTHCGPVADTAEKSGIVAQAISSAIDHFEKSQFAVTPLSDSERELVKAVPRIDWLVQLLLGLQLHSSSRSLVCALISMYMSAKQHLFDNCTECPCSNTSSSSVGAKISAEGDPTDHPDSNPKDFGDTGRSCSCTEARSVMGQTIPLLPSQARLERHFTTPVLISMLRFAWRARLNCLSHLVQLCGRALVQFPTSQLHCLDASLVLQLVEAAQSQSQPLQDADICRTVDRYLLNATVGLDDFLRLVQTSKPESRGSHDDLLKALKLMAFRLTGDPMSSDDGAHIGKPLSGMRQRLSAAVALVDFTKLSENSLMHIVEQQQNDLAPLPIDCLLQRAVKALVDIQQQRQPRDTSTFTHAQKSHQIPASGVQSCSKGERSAKYHRKRHNSGSSDRGQETSSPEDSPVFQKAPTSPLFGKASTLPSAFRLGSRRFSYSSGHDQPSKANIHQVMDSSALVGVQGLCRPRPTSDILHERDYGVNLAPHLNSGSDMSEVRTSQKSEEELFLL